MSWFELSIDEKIKRLTRYQKVGARVFNVLMIVWLVTLAGFIGKVLHYHNFVEGWDLSKDPVNQWIGLGIIALLWERAFDRMYRKDKKDGTTSS